MYISEDIKYIGVNDYDKDLFEGQFKVPKGMAYNSYVILDEKIAVMDTVDAAFKEEWLQKLEEALQGRKPDYLIVQHMEPDHSANIAVFMERYPEAVIMASAPAFTMIKNYFGTDYAERKCILKDGMTLELGKHTLQFMAAPMVHWPEVMVTYDAYEKVLFSADGFGKFGTLDAEEDWVDEARRYYFGIVGKFGMQVQALLKKAANLDIQKICPLHGPVLEEKPGDYLHLYDVWSSYEAEREGVVIAYTSVYGNTKKAVEFLAELLRQRGCQNVLLYDLARSDMYEAVAAAFAYDKLILATTTYNADIFPFMKTFIGHLKERNYQKRTVALVENGSWAPVAARIMQEMLKDFKEIKFTEHTVKIKAAVDEENIAQMEALVEELYEA